MNQENTNGNELNFTSRKQVITIDVAELRRYFSEKLGVSEADIEVDCYANPNPYQLGPSSAPNIHQQGGSNHIGSQHDPEKFSEFRLNFSNKLPLKKTDQKIYRPTPNLPQYSFPGMFGGIVVTIHNVE